MFVVYRQDKSAIIRHAAMEMRDTLRHEIWFVQPGYAIRAIVLH